MSKTQLKTQFRQKIKQVTGGPADKTRGAGVIGLLDGIVDELASLLETETQTMAGELSLPDAVFSDAPAAYQRYSDLVAYVTSLALGVAPWVAGKQTAGALVYSDAAVWRVKQDIANSTVGPTQAAGSTQYYEFMGGPAVLTALQQVAANTAAIGPLPSLQTVTQASLVLAINEILATRAERFAIGGGSSLTSFRDAASAEQVFAQLAAEPQQQAATNDEPPTLLCLGQLSSLEVPSTIRYLTLDWSAAMPAPYYSVLFGTDSATSPASVYKVLSGLLNGAIRYYTTLGAPGSKLTVQGTRISALYGYVGLLLPTETNPGSLVETLTLRQVVADRWSPNGLIQVSTIAGGGRKTRNVVINLIDCVFSESQAKGIVRVYGVQGTVTVNVLGNTYFTGASTIGDIKGSQANVVVNDLRSTPGASYDDTRLKASLFTPAWQAKHFYPANAETIRPDGLARIAALADFTSGSSYDESKWNVVDGLLSPTQVTSLLSAKQPVVGINADGSSIGYATLDAALQDSNATYQELRFNLKNAAITQAPQVFPSSLSGGQATITISDGLEVIPNPPTRFRQFFADLRFVGPTNGTGTGNITISGLAQPPSAYDERNCAQWENVYCALAVGLQAGAKVVLRDCYVKSLTGSAGATVYLYGSTVVDSIDTSQGLTVIYRRPTDVGAGGGGGSVDYSSPVVHTSSATLAASDLGKLHILSGNTPLTLTLPAGVAAGASVAVQVDDQSTALHTVAAASGTSLDGRALLRVWAGELRGWRVVGGSWNKTNGYVLPMSGKLRFPAGANQTASSNAVTLVQVSEVQEQTGPGLAQPAQYRLVFPRAGNWKIGLLGNLVGVPTGSYVEWLARLNGTLDARTVNGIVAPAANNGTTFSAVRVSETRAVSENDYVELVVYVDGGNGTVDNRSNIPWLLTTLYVEEQAPY